MKPMKGGRNDSVQGASGKAKRRIRSGDSEEIYREGGEVATSGTVRRVRSVELSLSSLDSESSSLGARLLPRTSTLLFICTIY
jgi:hypothetical protein